MLNGAFDLVFATFWLPRRVAVYRTRVMTMKRFLIALLVLVCVAQAAVAADSSSPLGRKIESFTLQDHRGAKHTLAAPGKHRATVIVMLGAECPLVKLYGQRLEQ